MRHTRKEVDLAPLLSEGLARDGAPGSHRGAQPVADGAGQPTGLHAGAAAGAPAAAEGPRPEAAVRLRAQGRRITLLAFHRVNFCKFGGGPNGIRTRVYSPPRAFLIVSVSYAMLTQHRIPRDSNSAGYPG